MSDLPRSRRHWWRGPPLGGQRQRGCQFAFMAYGGEATTSQIAEYCRPEIVKPTAIQIHDHARALRSIGAKRVRRVGRQWLWRLELRTWIETTRAEYANDCNGSSRNDHPRRVPNPPPPSARASSNCSARRRCRSTTSYVCQEARPPSCAWFCSNSNWQDGSSATAAPWCRCCQRSSCPSFPGAPPAALV
jgi:hypothetical protein